MSYKEYKVRVHENGTIEWYNDKDQLHREDGPAIVCVNGTKYWLKNGQRHREDGPAIVRENGDKYWYLDGKEYSEQSWKAELKRRSSKKDSLDGKFATIDGEKYKLTLVE